MNKIKVILASFITMFSVLAMPAIVVYAGPAKDAVCEGAQFATGGACDATAEKPVKDTITLAIRILQMIVGIISVFTIMIAGLGYVTSAGDGAKTKTAKDRILYAAVGLMVVVLAEVIVRFVLNRVSTAAGV